MIIPEYHFCSLTLLLPGAVGQRRIGGDGEASVNVRGRKEDAKNVEMGHLLFAWEKDFDAIMNKPGNQ